MHPESEESNVAAPPCFVQEPKQQVPQPAANRGVAVPAGTLEAEAGGVGRPGAVGNMHVLGDIGNVLHATGPAGINHPIIRRFSAQLLKKAQADLSKVGGKHELWQSKISDTKYTSIDILPPKLPPATVAINHHPLSTLAGALRPTALAQALQRDPV